MIAHQEKKEQMIQQIRSFVDKAKGLDQMSSTGTIRITQKLDKKSLSLNSGQIEEVLHRTDTDGEVFLQVNYSAGVKILITSHLIGFKPTKLTGLDMSKLPRVVTTPDILSVFEAIQEAIHTYEADSDEVKTLRQVFEALITGGEAVGFNLSPEKLWLTRIASGNSSATA